ncbi:MAG: ATP-binding protein, partial [Elusimicrobiota bacterium]|jgi:sensor histidine kinase regulating citrate/malate metabolism
VDGEEADSCRKLMLSASDRLIEEIQAQRELSVAERGELATKSADVGSLPFLSDLAGLYENHDVAKGKSIRIDEAAASLVLHTDRSLLARVVGNMLKNGLEASKPGETVTLGCAREGDDAVFRVHSPAAMPEKVQLQVFQRSFSTKGGSGRGLGTFSMKLLGEGYLKGKVWFESSKDKGTTFFLRLPSKKA